MITKLYYSAFTVGLLFDILFGRRLGTLTTIYLLMVLILDLAGTKFHLSRPVIIAYIILFQILIYYGSLFIG
jgi:hypothetical protein